MHAVYGQAYSARAVSYVQKNVYEINHWCQCYKTFFIVNHGAARWTFLPQSNILQTDTMSVSPRGALDLIQEILTEGEGSVQLTSSLG
jgi:hypothetical protein